MPNAIKNNAVYPFEVYRVDTSLILIYKPNKMEEPTPMPMPENEATQPVENVENVENTENAAVVETAENVEAMPAEEPKADCKEEAALPEAENQQPAAEQNEAEAETQPTEPEAQTEAVKPEAQQPVAEKAAEAEPEVDYSGMSREELVEAFQTLLEGDIQSISHRVAALRQRFFDLTKQVEKEAYDKFIAEGGVKEEYQPVADELTEKFRELQEQYKVRRHQYKEAVEQQKQHNLEAKQQTLDELRELIDSNEETLKQLYDRFNTIQEKWKTIGDVPREYLNDLWQNYHLLVEKFFNKVNINKELRQLDLKRNLEEKVQLCEKAEELIVEESVTKAFKELNALRDRWREIGPVPTEQNDEIWQRFCNAANQIDERRKEYYERRKEEMDKNLLAKQALVDKARELTENEPQTATKWGEVSNELDELLKLWKSIGPVPREANEEIWGQFKGMIDRFYASKKTHFSALRDEQTENYNRKIDLCLRAEAIAKRDDWKRATEELLQLQAEWKEIGPVSRKLSDKVWQRFRGACDEFFARKGEHFKNLRGSENENLAKKEAIIEQLKAYEFGDDKEENLGVIKDFQRQWMEIGHVPMSEKDRIQKEFRDTINAHFEKLKISAREAAESAYRERVQVGSGDRRFVSSERQTLMEKIEKLTNSIKLWDNNLGFLSNSRSADLLKQEFEKKIQNTRQQIALLEAKLKILDQSENEKEQK